LPADAAPSVVLIDELPEAGGRVTLSPAESRYLVRVCRARTGDRASASDGRGTRATVRLLSVGSAVEAIVESVERGERPRTAWVLVGPPEGERGDWLVEKLAELGVARFQPVDCARGAWVRPQRRLERWRRLAVAALRQSRRSYLLEVDEPRTLTEAVDALPGGGERWLADLGGRPSGEAAAPPGGLTIGIVGPSAGLTGEERDAVLGAGFTPIALSDCRLRTETAALAWACWWAGGARFGGVVGLDGRGDAP